MIVWHIAPRQVASLDHTPATAHSTSVTPNNLSNIFYNKTTTQFIMIDYDPL